MFYTQEIEFTGTDNVTSGGPGNATNKHPSSKGFPNGSVLSPLSQSQGEHEKVNGELDKNSSDSSVGLASHSTHHEPTASARVLDGIDTHVDHQWK